MPAGINSKRYDLAHVPRGSGVYALFAGVECLYVGSTINLYERLRGHRLMKDATDFSFLLQSPHRLRDLEQQLIDLLKPTRNVLPARRPRPSLMNKLNPYQSELLRSACDNPFVMDGATA